MEKTKLIKTGVILIILAILVITAFLVKSKTTPAIHKTEKNLIELDSPLNDNSFYYFKKAPKDNNTKITIIVIPGGAYAGLATRMLEVVGNLLTDNGINVLFFYYKVPEQFDYDNFPLYDLQNLIKLARKNSKKWDIDPDKIGLFGFSAGGHLSAMASVYFDKTSRPDFVILISPAIAIFRDNSFDPSKIISPKINQESFVKYMSPELHISNNTPVTYISHAKGDKIIHTQHILKYTEKLKEKNIPYKLKVFSEGEHCIYDHEDIINWVKEINNIK